MSIRIEEVDRSTNLIPWYFVASSCSNYLADDVRTATLAHIPNVYRISIIRVCDDSSMTIPALRRELSRESHTYILATSSISFNTLKAPSTAI